MENPLSKLPLILREHDGCTVVRGDLFPGGIKAKCLASLLPKIPESELVYTPHPNGSAGFALGLAGLYSDKKVTLFVDPAVMRKKLVRKLCSLGNVSFIPLQTAYNKRVYEKEARKYAKSHGAHFMPAGFDYAPFTECFIAIAQALPIQPEEVWVAAGSGTTSRCLARAWPTAFVNTVNLGMIRTPKMAGKVFRVPERPREKAELPPPYPSESYYDAKIWRFVPVLPESTTLVFNMA